MSPSFEPTGRCWLFGSDINTDYLAPGKYMRFGIDVIARHCLEDVDPRFAREVRPGDVIIAGSNFGAGSSREQAAEVLRHVGVHGVIAASFAGLFYRNAFNLGLPVLVGTIDRNQITTGEPIALDLPRATLSWDGGRHHLQCAPIPQHLQALVEDGGLIGHLEKRLAAQRAPRQPV